MVKHGSDIRNAALRLASALAFGGGIAVLVIRVGTHDLEEYEHAVFSLDRGTAVEAVHVFGHPVYTLAVGLGARLPLHGSLGASPAALVAPFGPVPLAYGLMLAFSIAAAALIACHVLEPLCGRLFSWLALLFLFWSVPIVNYTITDDWPEAAVTYGAVVACVFAPHALLSMLASLPSTPTRRVAVLSVAGLVLGLAAAAHPGYWPLLIATLALASMLAMCRSEYAWRMRVTVAAMLALALVLAIAPQAPDITRDLRLANEAGPTRRLAEGIGGGLLSANAFPFGERAARAPFTYLGLAMLSLLVGMRSHDAHARRAIVGSALISVGLGVAAATLSLDFDYAPSNTGGLRDPAGAFAVLSAASAAAVVRRRGTDSRPVGRGPVLAALVLAGMQGPAYAATLAITEAQSGSSGRWNQDLTGPQDRASARGVAPDRIPPGSRMAFWPGVRTRMRNDRNASVDFSDAGYLLVTAWTKQRTMRGLVEPNELLFNQEIELSEQVLCHTEAVRFLQLRYLLRPADTTLCGPWSPVPGLLVDNWLEVDVARDADTRIRALPAARMADPMSRQPGLSARSELLTELVPLPGTSLTIELPRVVLRLEDPSAANGHALVVPVAYDSAWRTSSGQMRSVGGLLALVGVDDARVILEFVPDWVAALRALAMTLAQAAALAGFVGLASVRPPPQLSPAG
ncbi:MAG: hypothetical protein A3I61_09260 [Acidobacteria bacterium RIFCSPLOWO2_02_FULL_68_18]|nr:MAG: hypothetical protein A3I61_09260 [Acidobacteria bacterium RIFCSPLOWO2_02_FULL_68_18]OFW51104.1 MAG: hypothetical protein A3G77_15890 [Acidobacteria bacterium RIFCSPLOWO2_12_FULL_68_19]